MSYDSKKPFTKDVIKMIKETWDTPYVSVKNFVYHIKPEFFGHGIVNHPDGVGTKGIYHYSGGTLGHAAVDSFAMNINDLLMYRATPFALTDHIYLPKDSDRTVKKLVGKLVKLSKKRDIAIVGGETAVHDDMRGVDISIVMNGLVSEKDEAKGNQLKPGNKLVGIASNGIHSNGYSIVRALDEFGQIDTRDMNDISTKEVFTEPTPIYYDELSKIVKNYNVDGMMHITGGAFAKLKGISEGLRLDIHDEHSLEPHPVFEEMYEKRFPASEFGDFKLDDEAMYSNFNCGIGFVLGTDEKSAEAIVKDIRGLKADIIGDVFPGDNEIEIKSMFSGRRIIL